MHQRVENMLHKEEGVRGLLKSSSEDTSQVETVDLFLEFTLLIYFYRTLQIESELQEEWHLLVRDLYSFYPLCIKYVDLQRSLWIKHPNVHAEELYTHVAEIFNIWSQSQVCTQILALSFKFEPMYCAFPV